MNKKIHKFTIKNETELQKFFNNNSLKMKKNSKLIFYDDLKIGQNILIEGNVKLGVKNKIHKDCYLKNVEIKNFNQIKMCSFIEDSKIEKNNIIGPFAYLRDNTFIKNNCIIGAYVEVTRSVIKNNTFISHRAFIGDAKISENVIIGAGVVFCNFNFKTMKKEKITVGKNCKIGSNSVIIAPKKIKANTLIPALSKK
jgi:bifunctional UDP-N-acetylglucosamine pyrophosphorylase/glucosamine-1-phosphate N-acetyltransferase